MAACGCETFAMSAVFLSAICTMAGAGLSPNVSTVLTYISGLRSVSMFLHKYL